MSADIPRNYSLEQLVGRNAVWHKRTSTPATWMTVLGQLRSVAKVCIQAVRSALSHFSTEVLQNVVILKNN